MSLMRFDEHHTHDRVVPLCFFGDPGLDLLLPLEGERLRAPEPPTAAAAASAGFMSSGYRTGALSQGSSNEPNSSRKRDRSLSSLN